MKKNDGRPLQEKLDSWLEKKRKERKKRELQHYASHRFILIFMLTLWVMASSVLCYDFNLFWACFLLVFLAIVIATLARRVVYFHPDGRLVQGAALAKWTWLGKGSSLKYSPRSFDRQRHDEIGDFVAQVALIVFPSVFTLFACVSVVYYRSFVAVIAAVISMFFLFVAVWVVRVNRRDMKQRKVKRKPAGRHAAKTVVETEKFPLVIGEENGFSIKQYGKPEEFAGCRAVISLVLQENDVIMATGGEASYVQDMVTERARVRVHEYRFPKTDALYEEFSFSVFLSPDDYVPSTQLRFLSGRVSYEWCLRYRVYSDNVMIMHRDFPVVITLSSP